MTVKTEKLLIVLVLLFCTTVIFIGASMADPQYNFYNNNSNEWSYETFTSNGTFSGGFSGGNCTDMIDGSPTVSSSELAPTAP